MNTSDILTAYKLAEGATKVWNEIWYGGKDSKLYVGAKSI